MGGGGAEPQYVTAKTSVWWDIENCCVPRRCDAHTIAQNISSALAKMNYSGPVSISAYGDTNGIPSHVQNALSSTGIALNHVPTGVKDASDKKILVDMLFWAVDNPAPANFLLISGDRDFSNALHQLRMRRYNILLAQPQKASAPLVAAAKSVWLWTGLLAGGSPLTDGESQQLRSNSYASTSDTLPIPVPDAAQLKQPMDSYSKNPYLANQKSPYTASGHGNKQKGKSIRGNINQTNGSKTSTPPSTEEDEHNANHQNHYPQQLWPNISPMQPEFAAHSLYPPIFHPHAPPLSPARPNGIRPASAPLTSVHDIGTLHISGYPINFHNPPNIERRNGEPKHGPKKEVCKSVSSKTLKKKASKSVSSNNSENPKKKASKSSVSSNNSENPKKKVSKPLSSNNSEILKSVSSNNSEILKSVSSNNSENHKKKASESVSSNDSKNPKKKIPQSVSSNSSKQGHVSIPKRRPLCLLLTKAKKSDKEKTKVKKQPTTKRMGKPATKLKKAHKASKPAA